MADLSALFAIEMIIAAFAGGAFGAAVGALPAFIFTGFMVIAGESANLASEAVAEAGGVSASELGAVGITGSIAFGPVFSPAISFAGGAAAAAYAAKRGYMDTGFDFHEAKNIAFAQGTKPDVLAVGGLFGVLGYWFTELSVAFAMPYDPIAMGVVLSAVAHRLVFGYSIVGGAKRGLLNMKPFESEERRVLGETAVDGGGTADGGEATDGGVAQGRFLVEPWLPHQYKWVNVATLGVVVGILAAYIAYETGSPFLAFGISAASLVFLNCGVEKIPVTHHMSLPASTAALALAPVGGDIASVSMVTALAVGAVFGAVSGLFGELFQRIFYAHADTHIDPPAAAIVFGTLLIAVLAIVGVFPQSSWVTTLGI
ncbi:hypothetical protein SAMN05421858_1692 [Haladaptatus litoreus]|uniref:DUF7973 domain-containing protein n=1 Tax=Haladaptatus litoreus TaxID=553468 RepID=A0A1N6YRZ5_9EURY|nr:hypothetical protein [Haladaptatus litoreus]SIR17428.1 hypothetical protein SAMN05421858_1692 [Haladaptatus litoreus]